MESHSEQVEPDARFEALPAEIQARVLEARRVEGERDSRIAEAEAKRRRSIIVEGVVIFAAFFVVGSAASGASFLFAPLVGAGIGWAWWKLNAGGLLSALTAMPAFFLLGMLLSGGQIPSLGLIICMYPMGLASAYVGSQRLLSSYL